MKNFLLFILLFLSLLSQSQNINQNDKKVIIKKNVYLSIPDSIYIIEGNRLEIFKHSIVKAINPNNYFLRITPFSGIAKGEFYDCIYIYDCKKGDTPMSLRFEILNNEGTVIDSKEVKIIPVIKKTNPSSIFNVLLIGDSFTSTKVYPNELYRRLKESRGTPVGDSLSNINFIGTTPKDSNVKREGHSGKSWNWFTGSNSPFWHKDDINLENYVSKNGYKKIDAVIILLGTNDTSNNQTIKKLLDYFVKYNPKIKGLVTGVILPSPLGGTGSVGLVHQQTFHGSVKNSLNYNRRVEDLIQKEYDTNFAYVDILSSFDLIHNMPYSEVPVNFRNQSTLIRQGTNNVHPAASGYLQIADVLYSAFHYFVLE